MSYSAASSSAPSGKPQSSESGGGMNVNMVSTSLWIASLYQPKMLVEQHVSL
jgi:hypothetical protein